MKQLPTCLYKNLNLITIEVNEFEEHVLMLLVTHIRLTVGICNNFPSYVFVDVSLDNFTGEGQFQYNCMILLFESL